LPAVKVAGRRSPCVLSLVGERAQGDCDGEHETQINRFPVKSLETTAAVRREEMSAQATARPKMALIAAEIRLAMPFLTSVGTPKPG
jgi:hypothetical protein